jgi:xanthosine utilization system XapX-like protein
MTVSTILLLNCLGILIGLIIYPIFINLLDVIDFKIQNRRNSGRKGYF